MSTSVGLLDEVITTFETKQQAQDSEDTEPLYANSLIRQYSGDLQTSLNDDDNLILSLDEDENDESKYENMIDIVKQQILVKQYAMITRDMEGIAEKCRHLILGFTRIYYKGSGAQIMPKEVVELICKFYPDIHFFCWNDKYLSLESCDDDNPHIFVLSKRCCMLSNLLKPFIGNQATEIIAVKKVRGDILDLIVEYLVHHKGKKPEEIAKPIRSVKMERICADLWDADYINKMTKKTIFQLILGANYMDIPSVLHLGCAKIATLIKGKSPEEIKNILADDSKENENKSDDTQQQQQQVEVEQNEESEESEESDIFDGMVIKSDNNEQQQQQQQNKDISESIKEDKPVCIDQDKVMAIVNLGIGFTVPQIQNALMKTNNGNKDIVIDYILNNPNDHL